MRIHSQTVLIPQHYVQKSTVDQAVEAMALEGGAEMGGDETSDYQTTRFEDAVHDFDVVFDTMAGEIQKQSWKVVQKGGTLVSIVGPPSTEEPAAQGTPGILLGQVE